MTSTEGLGDDNVLDGVFDRETPQETGSAGATVADTPNTEAERARDERGRFAAKSEPEPQAQAPLEQAPVDAPQTQPDPNANRHVPLSELLSERKQRQEKERLYIEAEARAKAYEQMLQRQPQQQAPQPQQQVEEEPDPYTDPQGWAHHQRSQFQRMMLENRATISRRQAERQYGKEAVQQAINSIPNNIANNLYLNSPDPYDDLMEWNKEQTVRKEVGTDLEAYRKKVEEEVRQKVLAELKAGGANGQPATKFPGSLANATASGAQGAHLSEEAAMGSIFSSSRDRKHG